ncbi:hypothetical protein KFU94_20815 [Chloroflexi bacterium TSY]|nr:hypothetical protein [Chloroflexi bacterium TSY]MBV7330638.1 hypothetical protein [Chloroflexi bacterium TSY]
MIQNIQNSELIRTMSFLKPRIWRYGPGVILMTLLMASVSVFEAYSLRYVMNAAIERELSLLVSGCL